MVALTHLEPELAGRLRDLRVQIDSPDGDTLILRNVPADARVFTKPRTNVLLKRPREGLPFLIGVDEDLEYQGADQELVRAFRAGVRQQGWRLILTSGSGQIELHQAIGRVLRVLGQPKPRSKRVPPQPAVGLLASFGCNLTELARSGTAQATVGRAEEIEQVAGGVIGWRGRLPLVVGDSGVGKTNLLHAVARKLAESQPGTQVISIDLGVLMAGTVLDAERENLLSAVLQDARASGVVVALERLEFTVLGAPRGAILLADALERGIKCIGTTLPALREAVEVYPLIDRLEPVELAELGVEDSAAVLETLRGALATHHRVQIAADLVRAAVERALPLRGRLPAKALALLDAAGARAALHRSPAAQLADVYIAATRMPEA